MRRTWECGPRRTTGILPVAAHGQEGRCMKSKPHTPKLGIRPMNRSCYALRNEVTRVLRTGLNVRAQTASLPPYRIKARSLGAPGFNYDKVSQLLEELEGPCHR